MSRRTGSQQTGRTFGRNALRGGLLASYESEVAHDLLMLGIWATLASTITWRSITKAS